MFLYIERNSGGYNVDKYCFVVDLVNKKLKQFPNKIRNKEEILEIIEKFKKNNNKDEFCFSTPNLLNGVENIELSNYINSNYNARNIVYLINNNNIQKIYEQNNKKRVPLNEQICHEIEQLMFVCGTRRVSMYCE